MERNTTPEKTTSGAVRGGYLLHSPTAIRTAAKLGWFHSLVIAGVVAAATQDADRWGPLTMGWLAGIVAWAFLIPAFPWQKFSHNWFAKIYFGGSGTLVVAAVVFDNPYLLFGIFPEAVCFADIYWYNKRLIAVHHAVLFGAGLMAAAIIGGDAALSVTLMMPVMVVSALAIAALGAHVIRSTLARTQFSTTVKSLLKALYVRDGYTGGHSENTVNLAMAVADELKLGETEREQLSDVALLHDIGKIGIPNAILQKPGKLDSDEWEVMRTHPEIGERILRDVPGFDAVAAAIRHEHERWDGGGYPDGIAEEEIPLASRIVLACDAYHAMTSDRPYRSAMDPADARAELIVNAGSQFDPRVVDALLVALESGRVEQIADMIAEPEPIEEVSASTPAGAPVIQLERAASISDDLQGTLTDPQTRAFIWTFQWAFSALAIAAMLAVTGFAWAGAAFVAFSAILAGGTVVLPPAAKDMWTATTGILSLAVIPVVAWRLSEPAMLILLVLPTWISVARAWDIRPLRVALLVGTTANFVVLPFLIVPADTLTLAAVCARAFPGVTLAGAYLLPHLRTMQFDRRRFAATMDSLMRALEARDGYTGDHSKETVEIAMRVADELSLTDAERIDLYDTALLHDIGKIGIPDEILNKPAKLTDEEWVVMREHPAIGEQIVSAIPGFEDVAIAIRHEHERWDGGGYPDGISGEQIPIASRIVLACDAFHAMTSDRPYRNSLGLDMAREELRKHAGTQFDPNVANALLAVLDRQAGGPVQLPGQSAGDERFGDLDGVQRRAFA